MGVPEITPEEAKKHLEAQTADFVDIRDDRSYQSGHIPGAKPLNNDTLPQLLKSADKSRPLVVNCYSGNSSQSAVAFLIEQGFQKAFSLRGGFGGWRSRFPETISR